jgi:glycosyltransferase involved in cell wall biosynthesis
MISKHQVHTESLASPRIAVNGRFVGKRVTGVQRYAHEITRRLRDRIELLVPDRGNGIAGHLWEQTVLAARARQQLLWNPCATGPMTARRHVTTIHDLFAVDHPEWYTPAYAQWHQFVLGRLVRSATRLIAVSEYTRQRLIDRYGCNPDQITVVHHGVTSGCEPANPAEIERVAANLQLPSKRYILTLSSLEPRKNIATTLRAWVAAQQSIDNDVWLVVAGAKANPDIWANIDLPRDLPRVFFTGYVPDDDLAGLYSGAALFLFPSLDEGFGFPLLEAMACGTRSIASKVPALIEVGGDAASYVEATDSAALASAIVDLMRAGASPNSPSGEAIERARRFQWSDAASRTLEVLSAAAEESARTEERRSFSVTDQLSISARADAPVVQRSANTGLRVALVHDWLTGMRGGEKVLSAICKLYPDAPLWTLLHIPGSSNSTIEGRRIHTSLLQYLPYARKRYRHYLPLYPLLAELTKARNVDLVISSSHAVAKSMVRRRAGNSPYHICYIHTPMRYAWNRFDDYFGAERVGSLASRFFFRPITRILQEYDRRTANRVDLFIANSTYVADQVRNYYKKNAIVITPPVDVARFTTLDREPQDWYLVVSALAPYKRVDDAIRACAVLGRQLKIVGTGPEMESLKTLASQLGSQVEFIGYASDQQLGHYYRKARALLFPGVEDFGIVPVEAIASGCPVIALGKGGILDSMSADTALFYDQATIEGLTKAISNYEIQQHLYRPELLRQRASEFTEERFLASFSHAVEQALSEHLAAPIAERHTVQVSSRIIGEL